MFSDILNHDFKIYYTMHVSCLNAEFLMKLSSFLMAHQEHSVPQRCLKWTDCRSFQSLIKTRVHRIYRDWTTVASFSNTSSQTAHLRTPSKHCNVLKHTLNTLSSIRQSPTLSYKQQRKRHIHSGYLNVHITYMMYFLIGVLADNPNKDKISDIITE